MSKIYPLRSSALKSAEHTDDGALIVTFRDGSRYHYSGVPPATVTGLLAAKSAGKFLKETITGKFKSKKL